MSWLARRDRFLAADLVTTRCSRRRFSPLAETPRPPIVETMTKLMALDEAIRQFVPDGASVVMGTALESLIPFAAGHELIRQRRTDLELIGPISDMLFDLLIGAGCVRRVTAAWVGNVSAGLGHNYRRAVEHSVPRPLELEEHSNFTVGLGLLAAAMGVPYLPTRSLLGSDLVEDNASYSPPRQVYFTCRPSSPTWPSCTCSAPTPRATPTAGATWASPARRASPRAQSDPDAPKKSSTPRCILSDPNRILLPPHRVSAVVLAPIGAHPSPVQGYYGRDHAFFAEYHQATREPEGFRRWLEAWVLGMPSLEAYRAGLGARFERLRPLRRQLAAAVDYA